MKRHTVEESATRLWALARLYDEPGSPFFDLEKADVWQSRFDALSNR